MIGLQLCRPKYLTMSKSMCDQSLHNKHQGGSQKYHYARLWRNISYSLLQHATWIHRARHQLETLAGNGSSKYHWNGYIFNKKNSKDGRDKRLTHDLSKLKVFLLVWSKLYLSFVKSVFIHYIRCLRRFSTISIVISLYLCYLNYTFYWFIWKLALWIIRA